MFSPRRCATQHTNIHKLTTTQVNILSYIQRALVLCLSFVFLIIVLLFIFLMKPTQTHTYIFKYTYTTSCFRERWKISCLKISKTNENDAVNNAVNVGPAQGSRRAPTRQFSWRGKSTVKMATKLQTNITVRNKTTEMSRRPDSDGETTQAVLWGTVIPRDVC